MPAAAPTSVIVYRARNLVNGHSYIGFTTKGLAKRESQHRRDGRLGYLRCARFSSALKKYGDENFVFEVMYDFDGDEELAKLYEIEAIEKYRPEYNLSRGGDGGSLAEETKQRISASNLGKSRNLGVPKSEETRRRMSIAMTGVPHLKARGVKRDPAVVARQRVQQKGHPNNFKGFPVVCVTTGQTFVNAKEAEKFFGLPKGDVSAVLNGRKTAVRGLVFERVEERK